ncbi:MAG TPA: protein translocase subunit SecD [bacterium]|nr:protein translocase subunit SecD [bacterium]
MQGQGWKIGLILFLLAGSFWFLYPTIDLYMMSPAEREELAKTDPQSWIKLQQKAMKLGLDLRGGMRLVLQVDKTNLNPDEASDAVERAKEILRNRVDQFGVAEPVIAVQGKDRIVVELPGISDPERARELIGRTALLEFKLLESPEMSSLLLDRIDRALEAAAGLDTTATPSDTAGERGALESLFGADTAKADTTGAGALAKGESPDLTQDTAEVLPPQIPKEAPLSSLLDPSGGYGWMVAKDEVPLVEMILARPDVQKLIPPDVEFAWSTRSEFVGGMEVERLYLLKKQVELEGKYLTDAKPSFDQFRKPIVSFQLTREGGRKFARLTGANINKPLAIVLDNRVESAPEIQSRIQDRGQITMGGNATYEDANDLAIVLRAGALPAPVKVIENNVIGPSLGQDSIRRGINASLLGLLAVFLIMAFYYKLSGLIANVGLLFNGIFLLGVMAVLHATLTMPGIAGFILSLGMSVDANVLIFERIREEMRAGKSVRNAIDAGYDRAMSAIIDSHVTTLITALALFIFGTGPIKGFAVTLFWGVAISLFTAVVVTRVVFDFRKSYKTLSI